MKYAYYNSCSLRSTGKEYDRSLRAVCSRLDIELQEPKDWFCCGSTIAQNLSVKLSLAMPLKNLAQINAMGLGEVMVPCTACYNRFKVAQYEVFKDPVMVRQMADIIEAPIEEQPRVSHPLEIMSSDENLKRIKELTSRNLSKLKIAAYYGCLLVRPHKETQFEDNPEYPVSMDRILGAAGIQTLDWSYKTECCGASLSVTKPDEAFKLTSRILEDARVSGADAVAVPCTFCQLNLDSRQADINKAFGTDFNMPIFYFSELLALAMEVPSKELLLGKHFVSTQKTLAQL